MWFSLLYDITKFWNTVLNSYNSDQDWETENEVVEEKKHLDLKIFNTGDAEKSPILVIPPNAGHHSNIAEKLVNTCMKTDPDRSLYSVNWNHIEESNGGYGIEDMVKDIHDCVKAAGGKVHLFTLCQGAWLGAIYTALFPDNVVSYVNAAGPIDFDQEDSKIKQYCDMLPMDFFRGMVTMNNGVQSGENQLMGFKNMNPVERWFGDYLDLWNHILQGNESGIQRWKRFKEWYEYTLNFDGKWYLEAVDGLFKNNKLVRKELNVLGRTVDLSNIKCPVYLLAGGKDDITLVDQVFNMGDYVSGEVKRIYIENAGHIGVFVKKDSLEYWASIIRDLDQMEGDVPVTAMPNDFSNKDYKVNPELVFETV